MISERITILDPFTSKDVNVDIEYEVSFYEHVGFDVEIKSLVTDEFIDLTRILSFEYLDALKERVMTQYKDNHQ